MAKQTDLPQVLLLKRKYITKFPNNQTVGLYYCESLNKYITVSTDNTLNTESVINTLYSISEEDDIKTIVFEDQTSLDINKECADVILVYLDNNSHLIESISSSDASFLGILEQAININSDQDESAIVQELEQK